MVVARSSPGRTKPSSRTRRSTSDDAGDGAAEDGRTAIGADAFTDRVITMNETDEEAVVAKSARVVEEVVVQKDVTERVETVRDTLRREEVEIDAPTATTGTVTSPARSGTRQPAV